VREQRGAPGVPARIPQALRRVLRCAGAPVQSATHNEERAMRNGVLIGGLLCAAVCGAAARAQDGDAIVIVNGRPITRQAMLEKLLEAHGLQMMQQLVVLELAREETARLKLRVSPDDIDHEFQRALATIAPQTDAEGHTLNDTEKRQSLDMLLQQKGLTFTEFMLGMERNAHLRKVVEQRIRIDEATLREEFARLYGEKVEVRHIQVGDVNGLHEALNRLDKGEDFAAVARAVSQNKETAANAGLLPAFAFNDDTVAPVLREAAFAMKPGEVSKPIRVAQWWHILKLERRVTPEHARFEEVRGEVERALRDRVIPQEMNKLVTSLFQKAEIRVLDANLKQKFDKLMRENVLTDPTARP
jgi:foldase protein PrsA